MQATNINFNKRKMKHIFSKLTIVFILTCITIVSCNDKDEINVQTSVDAQISSVTPEQAKPNYPITVNGNGFNELKEVFFNNTQITEYDLIDDSTIDLFVPNGAQVGEALVTLVYDNNARVASNFTVLVSEPPFVTNFENLQNESSILFEGANFFDLTVTLNNDPLTAIVNDSETTLSFVFPESLKNSLSGTLKIANLDGFLNFEYITVGDKLYFFKEDTYTELVIEDWDGNGLGAEWTGPHSGVTSDAGIYTDGMFGSYLRMTSSGESWGGGYEFSATNYGIPTGVSGKNIFIVADMKFNNPDATGVYIVIQLDDTVNPQVIYYGDDLPEYTANPGNIFWGSIAIDPEDATGEWQTIAWSQYHDFGPRYRNQADKTAALHPENELRPEDSDNLVAFKIQVPSDGLVDVDIDNVRVIYLD